MREYFFSQKELEEWMRQNEASYTGDFRDGTLLDNFVLSCKQGYAAVYEHPLNEWSSNYRVEYETGTGDTVWENWNRFCYEAEKEDH